MHGSVKGLLVPMGDWIDLAACRDASTEEIQNLFFGDQTGQEDAVRRYCNGCMVKEECLETAMLNRERNGVWGGTTEDGRRRLNDKLRKQQSRSRSA